MFAGWAIGNDERNWKYRLSIYYVKQFDTGAYTCTTSRGANNTITLRVSGLHKFTYIDNNNFQVYCNK